MGRLGVAFLWHMHQPCYVDFAQGRALLPWVRLHGLKDYADLPRLARRYPTVRQTFNLVPSLLDQLAGYASRTLTDPFLELASRPVQELTHDERHFMLREFFSYHPPTMGKRLPRLEELRRKRGTRAPDSDDSVGIAAWRESDFRDLKVLFHLAWCGSSLSEHPEVARLIARGAGYSEADAAHLLEIQAGFLGTIEEEYRAGLREGAFDLSVSPYYHPILPLLCDTGSGREAHPTLPLPTVPMRHPEDAALQTRLARSAFEGRFGIAPAGMWPSEGAISTAALEIMASEGVQWAASDEDLLFASLNVAPSGAAERSRILHRPYKTASGLTLFFRDHELSDRIGFVYAGWKAQDAADDFLARLREIERAAGGEERIVSVILDGENAWEHYQDNGAPFLSALFSRLASSDWLSARTFTEIAQSGTGPEPGRIERVRAGSWIRADLTTWIGDPVKNVAWDRLSEARSLLGPPSPDTIAGKSLLAAEGSDWFWWFGDEHSSAHDLDFDRTFRTHLTNAFRDSAHTAPAALANPITPHREASAHPSPSGPLRIALDGRASSWFEWLPAGRLDLGTGGGTMSRSRRTLVRLLYGVDGDDLALRCDGAGDTAALLEGSTLVVQFGAPSNAEVRAGLRRGAFTHGPVRGALGQILEVLVPLSIAGAKAGDRLALRVLLEDASGRPIESAPHDGFLTFDTAADPGDWFV